MIEIKKVKKVYISKRKEKKVALDNINLDLPDKGMCFILGETGSGKTTLLNLIGKLDTFDEGKIIVDGIDISKLSETEANVYRSREIGFIFQEYNLIEEFDVYDNIALSYELQGKKINDLEIKENLKKVNLSGYERKMINELSGGEKQRVTIARALIKKPRLILADEPTGALDNKTGRQILDILKEISKDHLVIVVSHNEEYAKEYGDIIVRIEEGKIKEVIGNINADTIEEEKRLEINTKSKGLSNLKALKLGIKNLRLKVKRLILMILVSSISFSMLSIVLSATLFDKTDFILSKMEEDGFTHSMISGIDTPYDINIYYRNTAIGYDLSKDDIKKLEEIGINAYPIFYDRSFIYSDMFLDGTTSKEYASFMEINETIFNDLKLEMLYGRLPISSDEVVLSENIFLEYKKYGYQYDNNICFISDYQDIIGRRIGDENYEFEIVGIIKSDFCDSNRIYESMYWSLNDILFVYSGVNNEKLDINNTNISKINYTLQNFSKDLLYEDLKSTNKTGFINNYTDLTNIVYFDDEKTELLDNEAIVDLDIIYEYQLKIENNMEKAVFKEHAALYEAGDRRFPTGSKYLEYIINNKDIEDEKNYYYFYELAMEELIDEYFKNDDIFPINIEYGINCRAKEKKVELKIVGYTENSKGKFFVNDATTSKLRSELQAFPYRRFVISFDKSDITKLRENGYDYCNIYTIKVDKIRNVLDNVLVIVLILSFALSLLSIGLFTNYLLILFDETNKQNKILLTLGASKKNILKNLSFQGLIIGVIVLIITIITFIIIKEPVSKYISNRVVVDLDIVGTNALEFMIIFFEIVLSVGFSILLTSQKISKKY